MAEVERSDCWPLAPVPARRMLAQFLGVADRFDPDGLPINHGLPDSIVIAPKFSPTKAFAINVATPFGEVFVTWAYLHAGGPLWLLPSMRADYMAMPRYRVGIIKDILSIAESYVRLGSNGAVPALVGAHLRSQHPIDVKTYLQTEKFGDYLPFYEAICKVRILLMMEAGAGMWEQLQEALMLMAPFPHNRQLCLEEIQRLLANYKTLEAEEQC